MRRVYIAGIMTVKLLAVYAVLPGAGTGKKPAWFFAG
jgi:hypothetical protein